ncbi:MAG: hypothetical protein K2N44_04230 [Lachnospiraceae bacterium]|nr:hypothetical protein [Lachnospiraceae bacterium]
MNINSSRNALLRSRNLRSARRSRAGKIISSRTSGTSSRSRFKAGSTKRTTSASASLTQTRQLAKYEQVEKAANSIQANVKNMLKLGKSTYTEDETGKKAQENDKNNLIKYIKNFVSDYNDVYNDLGDLGGAANTAFKKNLDSILSTNKTALKEIGITISNSGELTIDEKTLENADFDKVKALFAKEGGFADKVSTKMESIESAAVNSLTTLSKLYGATSTYNKYGTSNSYFNGYNNYSSGYSYYNYGNYGSNSGWYF